MDEHVYNDIPGFFGCMVFNDSVMRNRLPKDTYKALKRTIEGGKKLDPDIASIVANAMKNWAIEKGATHFTHWFGPMTGITAEKRDSFITPTDDGTVIMEFSGRELISGESDASSFPSGGLRATFEARGYTAWDPTSFAFVKDNTLYIPTVFCSYSGEALDKKTPLIRSMEALDKQAKRILRLFGTEAKRVTATVGPEQEYFLIDKEMFERRPDLIFCNRTLFGARPPKGQELDDHYYGNIKPRVSAFMKELDEELWKLGITAKTKHNEAAPAQHELAPVYTSANLASDHNQLTMEIMKSIAVKHSLACLLHEKPFEGVNGSGKHNNWSISTDKGVNLLEPGDTPHENAQFLLFLTAVIKAVDDYQDLLRISVASAGNDHRLGGYEAPPAIVSMYLGDELTAILSAIESGTEYTGTDRRVVEIGATVLPHFPKDSTDRNRTSSFAFTGNKFEFRMLGSAFSVAGPNFILNTIVAEVLSGFADLLERTPDFKAGLSALIRGTISAHKRILFGGNNYSKEWQEEAERRGLLNLKTTPEALERFIDPKNIELFRKHHIFSENELHSRYEIMLENYAKTVNIEALTLIDIINKYIYPAVMGYQRELSHLILDKRTLPFDVDCTLEESLIKRLATLSGELYEGERELKTAVGGAHVINGSLDKARYYSNCILKQMHDLRVIIDELEGLVGKPYWTLPTYSEILYSV